MYCRRCAPLGNNFNPVRDTRRLRASLTAPGLSRDLSHDDVTRRIEAAVGIASLWLVPRLAAFQQREPDVDVRLSADNRMVDLQREDIDLALRYIGPEEAPAGAALLFEEEVFPVAAPKLAAKLPAVLRAEDLARLTLLAFDNGHKAPWFSWEPWLVGPGLAHARPKAVLQSNQHDQLIRAAGGVPPCRLVVGRGEEDGTRSGRLNASATSLRPFRKTTS